MKKGQLQLLLNPYILIGIIIAGGFIAVSESKKPLMPESVTNSTIISKITTGISDSINYFSGPTSKKEYWNFYGISWRDRDTPCNSIDYAKSMGYSYVFYQAGMEDCPDAKDLKFYLESPENKVLPIWAIDTTKTYSAAETDLLAYRASNQIASGWWFSSTTYRPLYDFQRQDVIDKVSDDVIAYAKSKENKNNNFRFGGFAWDLPTPDIHDGFGKSNTVMATAYKKPGYTYDYQLYDDGFYAFRKELFTKAKANFNEYYIIYEPYGIYDNWIQNVKNRPDAALLTPSNALLCQESGDSASDDLMFVTDSRITYSKTRLCSTTPDTHDAARNLAIMGNAGVNGAWFNWFGRFGGTNGQTDYNSITIVPDRLKLVRVIANWDNLNGVALKDRSFNSGIYKSPMSYGDKNILYSRNPKTKDIYAVFLTTTGSIQLKSGEKVKNIYSVDSLFRKDIVSDSEFKIENNKITLTDSNQIGKGFIIEMVRQ